MIPLVTCGFIIGLILITHFWGRKEFKGLERLSPLDQEEKSLLPAPWAGHASSVFSLTALFGAYIGVILLVGVVAGIGLAVGSSAGLLLIRHRLQQFLSQDSTLTFEAVLRGLRFSNRAVLSKGLWILLLLNLIGFATSELILLREVAFFMFAMSPQHATAFALLVALSAYYYCLVGGYAAVFRTDVVQLFAVIVMCLGLVGYVAWLFWNGESLLLFDGTVQVTEPSRKYWQPPMIPHLPSGAVGAYQFVIGTIMGLGFLIASPDTWKRVFAVIRQEDSHQFSFRAMILAGFVPFVLLIPLILSLPSDLIQQIDQGTLFRIPRSPVLLSFAVIGMMSSFLSSFDSMLVAATHIVLVQPGVATEALYPNSLRFYRFALASFTLSIFLASLSLITSAGNPYFLANLLLGSFAIVAGLVIGTLGFRRIIYTELTGWLVLIALICWCVYFLSRASILTSPHPGQVDSVPVGALLFIAVTALTSVTSRRSIADEPN